jgi:YidC/Oxa1 family membrane protein insertase
MNYLHDFFTYALYQPLFNALIFLAWLIPGHSIGSAIIALTIIIRLALLPGSIKTMEHQRRMKALQPRIDALKDKHGDDKAAHSKATMELYASEKINPLGGCLPTLIQLPILLVLYRVFIQGLNASGFSLLYRFTPHMDSINTHWFGIDLTKPEHWVLPVLAAGLQFFQAQQMSKLTPMPASTGKDGQPDLSQAMSKQMLYFMPLMTFFITVRLPAALGLYWVATTLFMVAQQAWFLSQPMPEISNTMVTKKDNISVTIRKKGEEK